MPHTDETEQFTALSARLTGFDDVDLIATGLVEVYRAVAVEQLGTELYGRLLEGTEPVDDASQAAARAVTYLWYTGSWPGPPPRLVSSRAYAEALVWKAAGLSAPAAAPGGYGSWAEVGGR